MDFYVYDNIMTFNKRVPYSGAVNTRLEVNNIEIPENGSFWFWTDMLHERDNVNTQKRYVHIHLGVGTTNLVKFKKPSFKVTRSGIIYNPKTRRVEVKNSIIPWKKPLYAKQCIYYGSELPSKKMHILGTWYFDFGRNCIHFILDYFPQKLKFHWEEEIDNTPNFEQIARVEELEYQINEIEKKLSSTILSDTSS